MKHLLAISDLSATEYNQYLATEKKLKAEWRKDDNALYLSPDEIGLGKRESVADVARVPPRYVDGIFAHVSIRRNICAYQSSTAWRTGRLCG